MTQGGRNFFVGAVAIFGLVGLVLLLVLFGEVDRFIKPRYAITILMNDAGGLVDGSAVTLNGVPVGVVERVELADDAQYPVRVISRIDDSVQIPQPASAGVLVSLLGGRSTLLLEADFGPDVTAFYEKDGSASIHGAYIPLAKEFSSELKAQMQPILDAFAEFSTFAQTYSELGTNLNEMIKPADGQGGLGDVMARLTNTLDQVAEAMDLVKGWLGDEQLKADAKEAVAGANELLTKASGAVDEFTTLAKNLDTRSDDVAKRLFVVSDDLSKLLEDVNSLVDRTKSGEGTLGMLISNPDLYNSLNDAAVRLEQALREAQLLIEKLRQEGVNIKL